MLINFCWRLSTSFHWPFAKKKKKKKDLLSPSDHINYRICTTVVKYTKLKLQISNLYKNVTLVLFLALCLIACVIWDYGICGHLTELVARVLWRLQFEWQCKGLFIKTLWSFWLLQLPALHLYLKPSRTQQWHRRCSYKLHGFRPDICCVLFLFV